MTTQAAAISMVRTTTNRRNTTKEAPHRQRRSPLFDDEERSADVARSICRPSGASPNSDAARTAFFRRYVETKLPSRFRVALSTSTTKANPSKGGDAKLPVYPSLGRIHDSGVTESDAYRPVACSHGVPSVSVISLSPVKLRSARAVGFCLGTLSV